MAGSAGITLVLVICVLVAGVFSYLVISGQVDLPVPPPYVPTNPFQNPQPPPQPPGQPAPPPAAPVSSPVLEKVSALCTTDGVTMRVRYVGFLPLTIRVPGSDILVSKTVLLGDAPSNIQLGFSPTGTLLPGGEVSITDAACNIQNHLGSTCQYDLTVAGSTAAPVPFVVTCY